MGRIHNNFGIGCIQQSIQLVVELEESNASSVSDKEGRTDDYQRYEVLFEIKSEEKRGRDWRKQRFIGR